MLLWTTWACTEEPWAVSDEPLDDLVLARRFRVGGRDEVDVRCTSPDEPDEAHHVAGARRVDVYGLLADTGYVCTISGPRGTTTRAFRTDPLPEGLPTWDMEVGEPISAYTLFNHGLPTSSDDRDSKILIVDAEGRLRWYHWIPQDASDLDTQYLGDGRILYGGGYAAPPSIVTLDGEIEAEAGPSSTGRAYHHHAEQIADGTVWTFTVADNEANDDPWDGFAIDVLDAELRDRVWTWNSQEGVDAGWLPIPDPKSRDPYHANSLQVTDDAIYVNLRSLARIVKLDRATGALQWSLGAGLDFALVDEVGAPVTDGQWFGMSHAPEVQEDGNILIYDNHLTGPNSRVVEFALDEDARTAQIVWRWSEPTWFEPIWGDVDRLPNGHVLITQAHNEGLGEYSDDRTSIVEVDPETDAVTWRLTMTAATDASYRASRVDGCAIFANDAYCP